MNPFICTAVNTVAAIDVAADTGKVTRQGPTQTVAQLVSVNSGERTDLTISNPPADLDLAPGKGYELTLAELPPEVVSAHSPAAPPAAPEAPPAAPQTSPAMTWGQTPPGGPAEPPAAPPAPAAPADGGAGAPPPAAVPDPAAPAVPAANPSTAL